MTTARKLYTLFLLLLATATDRELARIVRYLKEVFLPPPTANLVSEIPLAWLARNSWIDCSAVAPVTWSGGSVTTNENFRRVPFCVNRAVTSDSPLSPLKVNAFSSAAAVGSLATIKLA